MALVRIQTNAVIDIFALLGCYAAYWKSVTDVLAQPIGPVLAGSVVFGTQVRRIFRAKEPSAHLPSEEK